MFNKDFYPTPEHVLDQMLFDVDLTGKTILDPSAGSGAILSYVMKHGAKEALCCENNDDLATIASSKGRMIGRDFLELKSDKISHINMIIANPPFSVYEEHILHMFNIAPAGCEIITLCNYDSYVNVGYHASRSKSSLEATVRNFGSIVNLGDCFSNAERKTNINIGLIKLFKPKAESDTEFEGYFDLDDEQEDEENGMIKYDEMRSLVNRYIGAVKMFDNVNQTNKEINALIEPIKSGMDIYFGAVSRNSQYSNITREIFKKELQKSAWRSVFNKLKMDKYVTRSVMNDINKFVEQQTNVPFTLKNIYKMIHMIIGTHKQRMERVVAETFDKITSHYKENRGGHEGWKTNDQWIVNRKFILPYMFEHNFSGKISISHRYSDDHIIDDLNKALCFLTGKKWDEIGSMRNFMHAPDKSYQVNGRNIDSGVVAWGSWFEFGFFRMKGYKKGSGHVEFLDEKVWDQFNKVACKAKGWQLPATTTHDFRKKSKGMSVA